MRVNVGSAPDRPRPGLLAGLLVLGAAAQPAVAAPRRAEQWYVDELRIDAGAEAVHRAWAWSWRWWTAASTPPTRTCGARCLPGGRSDGGSRRRARPTRHGHGTHMAGIIAATNASSDGVDGIAPGAKILPIKLDASRDRRLRRMTLGRSASASGWLSTVAPR